MSAMNGFFQRQLEIYAGYHRDERNCVTHIFGIPIIFLAVVLPLSLWPITLFGIPANLGMALVVPALIVWLALDFAIGLAISVAVVLLLLAATVIASQVSGPAVWFIAAGLFIAGWALQIIGHASFERRKPALLDNPMHMLIGPMFIMAKLFVALGFRDDLAPAMQLRPRDAFPRP
ncbi:MAG: Mpo1-like protein [Pseudolabrys sp.]